MNKNEGTANTIAIYARTAHRSIEHINCQTEELKNFVEQKGHEKYEVFWDDGFSGNSLNRPAFLHLILAIQIRHFSLIAVESLDRIARNLVLCNQVLEFFKGFGTEIITMDGYSNKQNRQAYHLLLETFIERKK